MTDAVWVPQIDLRRCDGCGECVRACPMGAWGLVEDKAALLRPEDCLYCAACEDSCPKSAIALPYLICIDALPSERPHVGK